MALTLDEISLESLFKFQPILDLSEKNFLIQGRYKVLKLFFETSRINVFLSLDTELKKKVFVHVAKNQFFNRGQDLKAWVSGVKAMKTIASPTSVFNCAEMNLWKNKFFLVTDYFDGIPLFHLLQSRKELPLHFVLQTLIQLCDVLEQARVAKIPNRLISREDFFVNRSGEIRIMRFLPAKKGLDHEEIVESSNADIFYLGCLMFELLTLERAFKKGRSADELERAHFLAILKIRKNQTPKDNFDQICDLFIRSTTRQAENRIESIVEFRKILEDLKHRIQSTEDSLHDEQEQAQLNSAFDVVYALKGDSNQIKGEEIEPSPNSVKRVSRVWNEFDLVEASKWEPEQIFRWASLAMIIAAFVYKFMDP